jgi:hypothetical protein
MLRVSARKHACMLASSERRVCVWARMVHKVVHFSRTWNHVLFMCMRIGQYAGCVPGKGSNVCMLVGMCSLVCQQH